MQSPRPNLKRAMAILRGEHDATLLANEALSFPPTTPVVIPAHLQAAANAHGIIRMDGGKGMDAGTATLLINTLGNTFGSFERFSSLRPQR